LIYGRQHPILSFVSRDYRRGNNEVKEMKRMMDIREKILKELDQKPRDTFSVSAIARAIGSNNNSTNAALGKLFKAGLVDRPQKGVYSSKGRFPQTTAALKPAQAKKTVAVRTAKPTPEPAKGTSAPTSPLSIITIDLLVEGEQSKIDASGFVGKVRENRSVLDARVSKITAADQTKLKIRFSFPDED
jgi:hypothetical protein